MLTAGATNSCSPRRSPAHQGIGPVAETFALDGPSNVTGRSGTTETYDKANRLTDDGAVHNTWSDADRLVQRGTDTFIYDALDRMTSSNVGGTARTYTYNGDGLLQTRTGGVARLPVGSSTSAQRELKQSTTSSMGSHRSMW